jgi:hypothetical protein
MVCCTPYLVVADWQPLSPNKVSVRSTNGRSHWSGAEHMYKYNTLKSTEYHQFLAWVQVYKYYYTPYSRSIVGTSLVLIIGR